MASPTLLEDLAAIRTRLRDRIDPKLATIVAASVLVHLGIAVWAWTGDVDTGQAYTPSVAQRFYQETIDVRIPDEPVSAVPGVAQPVSPRQVPAPIVKRVTIATKPQVAPDPERLAMLMTGEDSAANGAGEMRRRRPGGDLDKQIAELGTHPVTVGHPGIERPRIGTDQGPLVDVPTLEQAPPKVDRDPGRITVIPTKQPLTTTLTPELVIAKIQNLYIRGLQRCYQRGLVGDAMLAGRVSLAFTIDTAGHTSDTEASGLTDPIDSCIQNQVASWRFPVPRNAKTSQPIEMPFALVLALQSN